MNPGQIDSFAIWVWTVNAPTQGVSVTVQVAPAAGIGAPAFDVCPLAGGQTCAVGSVPTGQADELQAWLRIGANAVVGEHVQVTAKVTALGARSFTASATDVVSAQPTGNPTSPAPTPTPTLPPTSLPPIPGTGVTPSNVSNLFPTVGPAPTPSPSPIGLPQVKPHRTVHVAEVAATVPLDARLLGGQIAGLAVLAGGVALAIARLSLRTPKPPEDDKNQPPS